MDMDYGKFGNCLEGRLYAIRKNKKLNQEEFGKRLGVTRSAICNYESGTRPIGEQVILAVCREFKVNELWMRHGVGNPYSHPKDGVIDQLIEEYQCSKFEGDFLKTYFQMDDDERLSFVKCIYRLITPLVKNMEGKNPFAYYFDVTNAEGSKMDKINRDVAEFRKKLIQERYGLTADTDKMETVQSDTSQDNDSTEAAEADYRSSSGFVQNTGLSASNTTGDTASPNDNPKEETTEENGGVESGNDVG